MINLRQEIDHLQRTQEPRYSSAFAQLTKEYSTEEKKGILKKIANIEAHLKYCEFLKEQEKRFAIVNVEKEEISYTTW